MVEIVRICGARIRERVIISSPEGYVKDVLWWQWKLVFDGFKHNSVQNGKEIPGRKLPSWLT